MKKSFIFTFIMAILGAIIGAGFASGKEIASFFGSLGIFAIPFIFVACILFFLCFYLFCQIGKMIKPKSISDITKVVFNKASVFVDLVFVVCTFITLASMLAGCDSIGTLTFNENYNFCYISIATALIVTVIISVGLKYIYRTTNIILPIMIGSIFIILTLFLAKKGSFDLTATSSNFKFFNASITPILYVSMNIFTNIFIIAKTSEYMNKKQIKLASIITSGILFLLLTFIFVSMLIGGNDIISADMPLLKIAYSVNTFVGGFYSLILWFAIFTTITLASFTLTNWLNNYIKNKFLCSVIVLTVGFILSRFGFSTIVQVFYPIEGIFGVIFIVYVAIFYFKNKKTYLANKQAIIFDSKMNEVFKQHFDTEKNMSNFDDKKITDKLKDTMNSVEKADSKKEYDLQKKVCSIHIKKKNGQIKIEKKTK